MGIFKKMFGRGPAPSDDVKSSPKEENPNRIDGGGILPEEDRTLYDEGVTIPEEDDRTVYDEGATVSEEEEQTVYDGTVYEGEETVAETEDETVPEEDGTVYEETLAEAALTDAARHETGSVSNADIRRGDVLLDTYRVESDSIDGGMGSVWRVHHEGWNVDLAMKRPQAKAFRTEHQKDGFIRECESWINLGLHPNIVSCYYVRELGGVPTIFSEWMENGSLENRIRDGSLYEGTEDEVAERLLDIAIQFARGLHYAHEAGLIHQDVKPDNLLLSEDWDAKVSDFGLARARAVLTVRESSEISQDNAGMTLVSPSGGYTPAYCSMEQMDGKTLSRRTDIYSWGVSIMEMYLGKRPWMNGVAAGLACSDYLRECRVPMPEALQSLLICCMQADPEERYPDFAIVEEMLESVYFHVTGKGYPRPAPTAAADTADSLNNRALSFLDLGRMQDAEILWNKALAVDNSSFRCHYNRAVALWKANRITGEELLQQIEAWQEDTDQWRQAMESVGFARIETAGNGEIPEDSVIPFRKIDRWDREKAAETGGVYERSRDGRRTIAFDEETGNYVVRDPEGEYRFPGKRPGFDGGGWQFADSKGDILVVHGYDVRFIQSMTGRSLLTFHSQRDWEGDVIFDRITRVSEKGYVKLENYQGRQVWLKLPPAAPRVDYMVSRIESFSQRREAMEQLIENYPRALERFRKKDYAGALALLAPSCENGTLLHHEEALDLWEDLFPYCTADRLMTVLPVDRPTVADPLPFPAEPERDWTLGECTDGETQFTVKEHYDLTENTNTGCIEYDFIYSARARDAESGALHYIIDKLTTDAQDDSGKIDFGLYVKLAGQYLWYTKNNWGWEEDDITVVDLGDPEEQRKRRLRLALPGTGDCFLQNTAEGVDIGGFFFEDEYQGLGPLWDAQVIQCRNKAYRLIYQYTNVRQEAEQ